MGVRTRLAPRSAGRPILGCAAVLLAGAVAVGVAASERTDGRYVDGEFGWTIDYPSGFSVSRFHTNFGFRVQE